MAASQTSCITRIRGTAQLVTSRQRDRAGGDQLMNARHTGSVLVRSAEGGVAGILTERDLLTRVLAAERDPKTTRVNEL